MAAPVVLNNSIQSSLAPKLSVTVVKFEHEYSLITICAKEYFIPNRNTIRKATFSLCQVNFIKG